MNKIFLLAMLLFCPFTDGREISVQHADLIKKSLHLKRPDSVYIFAYLNLAEYEILKTGENKKNLDSAALFLRQAALLFDHDKRFPFDGYNVLLNGLLQDERGHYDSGKVEIIRAVAILKAKKDYTHLGEAYLQLSYLYNSGAIYFVRKENKQKLAYLKASLTAYQKTSDIERQAFVLQSLSDVYQLNNLDTEAIKNLEYALLLYYSIKYTQLQEVYILLGQIYSKAGKYHQAFRYAILALKTAQQLRDTTMSTCRINNTIGVILHELGDNKIAKLYYNQALMIAERHNDRSNVSVLIHNISQAYILTKEPELSLTFLNDLPIRYRTQTKNALADFILSNAYANSYIELCQYGKAKPFITSLSIMAESKKLSNDALFACYTTLALFYIGDREYLTARYYLRMSDQIIIKSKGPNKNSRENARLWFRLDTATRNYRGAVRQLLRYDSWRESILADIKHQQYEQIEKELRKGTKSDKQPLFFSQVITEKKTEKWMKVTTLIAMLTLVLIILLLMAKHYLLKKRSQKLNEDKNEIILQKSSTLELLLKEKEWLLEEVQHRVKNNLHTVICLLESQSEYLDNDAFDAIKTSEHRIYAMSLIHKKLYVSEDITKVDMAQCIPELIQYLKDNFRTSGEIKFVLDIQHICLSLAQAVPLALILNEIITNAIKYAFRGKICGVINLTILNTGNKAEVVISDNGIGMDKQLAITSTQSLGFKLIKGLSEDLGATLTIESNQGTKISLVFDVPNNF